MSVVAKGRDRDRAATKQNVPNAAREYFRRGWAPVPIPHGEKAPRLKGWPELRLTEVELATYFPDGSNVGILLGESSHGLVDIDLDASQAARVAPRFLPPTQMAHGRKSKPGSHLWYVVKPPPKSEKFTDLDGSCLVELRSTGQQTIVPPSVHPTGEIIVWERNGEPACVDGDALRSSVACTAACALAARHWPAPGRRNEAALAFAGWLLRSGWEKEAAMGFVSAAAQAAGDEEWQERMGAVHSTARRLSEQRPATGMLRLSEILSETVCTRLRDWLGLRIAPDPEPAAESARGETRRPSQATRLIALAADAEIFCTPDGSPYATVPVRTHFETWATKSSGFRQYLARKFYETEKNAATAQALQDAIGVISAKAQFDSERKHVFTRVAELEGDLWLDLGDTEWRAVEITSRGWRVVENPPVRFRRARGMLPLPEPIGGGAIAELKHFLNLAGEEDWALVSSWSIAALRPRGPFPILILHGEQGSAKSTAARVIRAVVDPYKAALRSAPRDERDLVIAANNSHIIALDNISHMKPWLSDALCRLATGGGLATRELYKNDEEVIFEAQRPILLNGIEDLATRGDFLERSVVVYLPEILSKARQEEKKFWAAFEEARPRILGALLDVVSKALRKVDSVELEEKPRMADFAVWASAAEAALELAPGSFLRAYAGNRQVANDLALESSPVASEICALVHEMTSWEGTAGTLLRDLNSQAGDEVRKQKTWPKSPRGLSGALRRLAPNLRAVGVFVTFPPREPGTGRRLIRLENRGDFASQPSPSSQPAKDAAYASPSPADQPSHPTQQPSQVSPSSEGACDARDGSDGEEPDFSRASTHRLTEEFL